MLISLIHPSFNRPDLAFKCYHEWMSKATDATNIEYILSLAETDGQLAAYKSIFAATAVKIVVFPKNGLVKQANYGAEQSTGTLLIGISDDFGCTSQWDTHLIQSLHDKSDYVVKTVDGLQPFIMTLPMMDRVFYESIGHIYHPDYYHMYGDEELAEVGQRTGKTINLNLNFPHRHYSTGKNTKDHVNTRNDSFYLVDRQTFLKRKANNFDL